MGADNRADKQDPTWRSKVSKYGRPDGRKAAWQIVDTFLPYVSLWAVMIYTVRAGYPYFITFALAVLAALFLVRIFILFHDCTHGSFFASSRANRVLGYISGVLTFTAFEEWRRSHAKHHLTVSDLDRRGTGDVRTMTVDEYLRAPWLKRMAYRAYRHPLTLFVLGPPVVFILLNRFFHRGAGRSERSSVIITDLLILAMITAAGLAIGFREYLVIQLPTILIAGSIGIWLFYVQHQFENVYWARHDQWDRTKAALQGASYYKLPGVLQWFTGNIGLHHIHHIRPTIPNYNLQRCYDEVPEFQEIEPLTVLGSLKSLRLRLWDEETRRLVSFRSLGSRSRDA